MVDLKGTSEHSFQHLELKGPYCHAWRGYGSIIRDIARSFGADATGHDAGGAGSRTRANCQVQLTNEDEQRMNGENEEYFNLNIYILYIYLR